MNYKKKYIKYKNKYLKLKNKNYQIGGEIIKTISNDGRMEGMSLQCFWISILQYLRKNGFHDLTLRELRMHAGLHSDTEHTMFDTYAEDSAGNHFFITAAEKIANVFHINIQVYTAIREYPYIIASDEPAYFIPLGVPNPAYSTVKLANFGMIHFELIDPEGKPFVPLVEYRGIAKKINEVPEDQREVYLQNSIDKKLLKDLESQKKKLNDDYNKDIDTLQKNSLEESDKKLIKADYENKYRTEVLELEKLISDVKTNIEREELVKTQFMLQDKINSTSLQDDKSKLKTQLSVIQSSLRGNRHPTLMESIGKINEDLSKEIEIFNLEDKLDQQKKYLEPLIKIIEEIQKSIKETENNIIKKKKNLVI
jgi:hypothetical protein